MTLSLFYALTAVASAADFSGSGTEGDPYVLSTAEHLKQFAEGTLPGVGTDYDGKYFHIANQIDATGITIENPLYSFGHPFIGSMVVTTYTYTAKDGNAYAHSCPVNSTQSLMVVGEGGKVKGMPANLFQIQVSGLGTEENPYLIETAEQLSAMSGYLSAGAKPYDSYCNLIDTCGNRVSTDAYYKLNADIDMSGYNFAGLGTNGFHMATAYGSWRGDQKPFAGHFDGNHKTIFNLQVIKPAGEMAGFITRATGASVKDLNIDNFVSVYNAGTAPMGKCVISCDYSNIHITGYKGMSSRTGYSSGTHSDGAFAGYVSNSRITNCSTEGSVQIIATGSGSGGFIGVSDNSTVDHCAFTLIPVSGIPTLECVYYTSLAFSYVNVGTTISDFTLNVGENGNGTYDFSDTADKGSGSETSILAPSVAPGARISGVTINGNFKNSRPLVTRVAGTVENVRVNGIMQFADTGNSSTLIVNIFDQFRNGPWDNNDNPRPVTEYGVVSNVTATELRDGSDTVIDNPSLWDKCVKLVPLGDDGDATYAKVAALTEGTLPASYGHHIAYFRSNEADATEIAFSEISGFDYSKTNMQTIYYKEVPNTYTIQFVGGDGSTGSVGPVSAVWDDSYPAPTDAFTKADSKLVGWDTDASADNVIYTAGSDLFNLTDANNGAVTLYAVWETLPTRTDVDVSTLPVTVAYNGTVQSVNTSSLPEGFTISYRNHKDGTLTDAPKAAGSYDVIVSYAQNENYAAYRAVVPIALTIKPIQLTLSAKDVTLHCNETSLPTYEYELDGSLADGESFAAEPAITSTASGVTVGEYPITVGAVTVKDSSGADVSANYQITYIPGTLEITDHTQGEFKEYHFVTCTEAAYTEYACAVDGCDGIYTVTGIPARGHHYAYITDSFVLDKANDYTIGVVTETGTCVDCGVTTTRKQHHIGITSKTAPATCVIPASVEYTCSHCKRVFDVPLAGEAATGEHIEASPVRENVVEATYETEGSCESVVYCATCGKQLSRTTTVIPKLTRPSGGSSSRKPSVTVTDEGGGKAVASSNGTVTMTPDEGYEIGTVTVNGKEVPVPADGKLSGLKSTDKVVVTFVKTAKASVDFVDVSESDPYYDAVQWAVENGITSGVDATHFAPEGITTRAQMVTFLWRRAGCPAPKTTDCPFVDVPADSYYYKATLWGYENVYVKGTSTTTFSPDLVVTRGQAVAFLARIAGVRDEATGYTHNFIDVMPDDYYNNAISWAAANNITNGTSLTTFSPDDGCLRNQAVLFLYRSRVK